VAATSVVPKDVLVVRRARTATEQAEAQRFVEENFWIHFRTKPHPPQTLFVAYYADAIVGTMALDFASAEDGFPFEVVYNFDHSATPWPFERENGVQYSRWITKPASPELIQRLSPALIRACTLFALQEKKTYGWCVIKPSPAHRLKGLGIELRRVESAEIDLKNIPNNDWEYFTKPPQPQLQMMRLSQIYVAVEAHLQPFTSEGLVAWED